MTKRLLAAIFSLLLTTTALAQLGGQPVNIPQQVTLQGLRSSGNHGKFAAAAFELDGSMVLLYDQQDGIRLIKADSQASTMLAQSQTGAAGSSGIAMALDAAGNIYVTGTTSSTSLSTTTGAAFPTRTDTSTNSFLAKYDANLNLQWLTFLGAGSTAASAIATNGSSVLVTGLTYSQTFPVTASAIQQTPSPGYNQNGFVECFSATGTLTYATYLNGTNGGTTPIGIATDSAGNAYVTGSTAASGFPTINALVPRMTSTLSGFLSALNASGSAFLYSTFLPGTGMTSIAIDSVSGDLVLSGNLDPANFPFTSVTIPMIGATYVSVLRMPLNGQTLTSSQPLLPGTVGYATPAADGSVWVSGNVSVPIFPGLTAPDYEAGDSFLLRVTAAGVIDQTLRVGGLPTTNALYASSATTPVAPAVYSSEIVLPSMLSMSAASSLLATQQFDFPLVTDPNVVLPNSISDLLPLASQCTNSSQCTGTAGLLTMLNTTGSTPSFALSLDMLPQITLRNFASSAAAGVSIVASGYSASSDCQGALPPSTDCSIALNGSGPGTLTVSAANAQTYTVNVPATSAIANPIALSAPELDFGIVTSTSSATRTLTLTNFSATPQTFSSQAEAGTTSQFTEIATTCGAIAAHTIPANSTCTVTLRLITASIDGLQTGYWKIAGRDVRLTGFLQANALQLSSTTLNFGTIIAGSSLTLPRTLYLSNNGSALLTHNLVTLPSSSPFTVMDNCPQQLEAHSVCQITFEYSSPIVPSNDATTVTVDGNSLLVTGDTISAAAASGAATNPSLSVSSNSINFATSIAVTQVSGIQQSLTVANTGGSAFILSAAISGDFQLMNTCPAILPAQSSCTLYLNFAPSQPGLRNGVISLSTTSSFTPTVVSLSGTASAILAANNGLIDVGDTYVGEPIQIALQITQALPSLMVKTSGLFSVAIVTNSGSTTQTLAPGLFGTSATSPCNSCYLVLEFPAPNAGSASGTLSLSTASNGNPYVLALTANALSVSGLVLFPRTQDFGSVAVHSTSVTQVFELANLLSSASGTTIQSVAVTGDFKITANTTGGASCIGTLSPTEACYLELSFAPTTTGPRTGTLSVTTDQGTATSSLAGYGNVDPGISFSPSGLIYRLTPDVSSGSQTITITNTGSATLVIGEPKSSAINFTTNTNRTTLAPGAYSSLNVNFTPGTAPVEGTLNIPVTVSLNGQTEDLTTTLTLSGTYTSQDAGLQILSSEENLGASAPGSIGLTREFTLRNLTAQQLNIALQIPHDFPLADPTACAMLAAGASCNFSVCFVPSVAGSLTGTIFAQGASSSGAMAQGLSYLLGYAAGAASLTLGPLPLPNSPLTFSQLQSGQSTSQTLTLTNTGTIAANVRSVLSNPPFLSSTTCGNALATGSSCSITVSYAPIDELLSGSASLPRYDTSTLTIVSDAADSPLTVSMQGSVAPVSSSAPSSGVVLATYSLSQGALTFANTAAASSSATQTVTIQNTGTTVLHFSAISSPLDFRVSSNCATLAPGSTCYIAATFTPVTIEATTTRSAAIEIASDAALALNYISLFAVKSNAPLQISPTSLNFGTVKIGDYTTLPLSITNVTAAPITFIAYTTTSEFSVSSGTCPAAGSSLAAGANCILNLSFTPQAAGASSGTLSLVTDATSLPLTIALTGSAVVGALTASPSALAFGSIAMGSTAPLMLTLSNSGGATVNNLATSISGTNAGDFLVSSPCSTTTLAPNQGCAMTVAFTPAAVGTRTAMLNITSDSNSVSVPLSGTEIQLSGSFSLTVNGGSIATATINAGEPAAFALTLTPSNNFAGTVALTCTPTNTAQYASCSLLSPSLTLGGGPQFSTVTINTLTASSVGITFTAIVLVLPLFARKRHARWLAIHFLVTMTTLEGCGGHATTTGTSNLHYTPAGTYQYVVTAAATNGQTISSSVSLTLIVK